VRAANAATAEAKRSALLAAWQDGMATAQTHPKSAQPTQ
jgi:hypothetical protein